MVFLRGEDARKYLEDETDLPIALESAMDACLKECVEAARRGEKLEPIRLLATNLKALSVRNNPEAAAALDELREKAASKSSAAKAEMIEQLSAGYLLPPDLLEASLANSSTRIMDAFDGTLVTRSPDAFATDDASDIRERLRNGELVSPAEMAILGVQSQIQQEAAEVPPATA